MTEATVGSELMTIKAASRKSRRRRVEHRRKVLYSLAAAGLFLATALGGILFVTARPGRLHHPLREIGAMKFRCRKVGLVCVAVANSGDGPRLPGQSRALGGPECIHRKTGANTQFVDFVGLFRHGCPDGFGGKPPQFPSRHDRCAAKGRNDADLASISSQEWEAHFNTSGRAAREKTQALERASRLATL